MKQIHIEALRFDYYNKAIIHQGKASVTMDYISVKEASHRWGVSPRQVQRLLAENRIPLAKKYGRAWMIPRDAEKPADARREMKSGNEPLSSGLAYMIESTSMPMPSDNPDGILNMVKEEKARLQYESELAYLRGDFGHAMRCCDKSKGDEAAKLRACMVEIASAISMGDYPAYLEIEAYLKSLIGTGYGSDVSAVAELALAGAAVSVSAPNMVPVWLQEGDFGALPAQAKLSYMLYLRAKYFMCIGKYETALAVAQTALSFCLQERGITFSEIYLRVICALASHFLGRENDAGHRLLEAMHIALPYGFITPFAELVSEFGGLMERCLEEEFPEYLDAVLGQWESTVKNWITFHNHFTRDNITLILTLREYHIAQLVARRVSYADIAKRFNISVGRLKNIMLEIYEKLFISSRDELGQYLMIPEKEDRA